MKILALDSSEATASVALTDDLKLLGTYSIMAGRTHSETLLPMIKSLLDSNKMHISDVDMIACSAGPGSFTGVRIAVATAKGLAFDKNIPCLPVSTLEALAYNLHCFDGIICPCMDARREQLYNAVFDCKDGNMTRISEDRVITLDALENEIFEKYPERPVYISGSGSDMVSSKVKADNIIGAPELLKYEEAYSVAVCAYKKYKNNAEYAVLPENLSPVYLRPSQAERERIENKSK